MEVLVIFLVFSAAFFGGESKYVAYNTSQGIVSGKINVHLVPHTHDDVGWLKTVDQYYVGSNNSIQGACVQNVLDSLVPALLANKNRKFIYVEQAFFQRWWREQSLVDQEIVKKLVNSGQLELINGGMCMHDEAATHYIDMIDQTTLGHRFIKQEFDQTPRIGWQIDPFGHSAVQAYLLGAEVGFDSLFFGRIDYQDRAKRKDEKNLEFVWQGSKTLGSSAQIFAGAFPENYEPPGEFYFEVDDESPIIQDNMNLFDYNVQDRVDAFVAAAMSQANITRTNHIMWTMGTDFKYQYAHTWFRQMDKFIHYVNKDGRVNALYSTPSIYTDAKYATNEAWPLKTNDFFPYADRANAYWTGYFTSRPAIKRYVRIMSAYYLAARQLEFFKGRNQLRPNTDTLADALAIAQHHDAVSGTEKQHVANDYAKRLSMGYVEAEELVSSSLACLAESTRNRSCGKSITNFEQCPLLNISYCPPTEVDLPPGKSLVVVVYNPLGWKREDIVRIPVISASVSVWDSTGKEIESQILPMADASVGIRNSYVRAYLGKSPGDPPKYWLAFLASVPPLGFSTYIVSSVKTTAALSKMATIIDKLANGITGTLKVNGTTPHTNGTAHATSSDECIHLEHEYSAHNYHPLPVVFERAEGAKVWDPEGNEYIDMLAAYSAVNQGHCHPKIVAALVEQASKLTLSSRAFHNSNFGPFAKKLTSLLGYDMVLPMNTGAEAVETALKLARKWAYKIKGVPTDRAIILSAQHNFHGRTIGVISMSTDPESRNDFGPFVPNVGPVTPDGKTIRYNNVQDVEEALEKWGKETAAFLVEPIQGEAGVVVPDHDYLERVQALCRKHNVLLICDEIQTGFARTGKMLCFQHNPAVKPDIITLGKALSGGIYPVSAVLSSREIMMTIKPGEHGSTYGGNPLACAVASAALDVLVDEDLSGRAERLGKLFREELGKLCHPGKDSWITEVRGLGLMNAIVIDESKSKKGRGAWQLCLLMKSKGLLAKPTHVNIIRLTPPIVITEDDLLKSVQIIKESLEELDVIEKIPGETEEEKGFQSHSEL